MMTYHVSEIYAHGTDFPVPGPSLWNGEAEDAIEALSRYSATQGFAPYERLPAPGLGQAGWGVPDPMERAEDFLSDGWETPEAAIEAATLEFLNRYGFAIPTIWNDDGTIASAPFTNTEIMAYTDEAIS
jgi:hypothetical protein